MAFNLEKCGNDVNVQQQGIIKLAGYTDLMEQSVVIKNYDSMTK